MKKCHTRNGGIALYLAYYLFVCCVFHVGLLQTKLGPWGKKIYTSKMFQYAVVEFLGGCKREIGIVCMSWLIGDGNKTLWPPTDVGNKQRKRTPPGIGWKEFEVRIIDRAVDYEEAEKFLERAQYTSDVRSENEGLKRKRNKRRRRKEEADYEQSLDDRTSSEDEQRTFNIPDNFSKDGENFKNLEVSCAEHLIPMQSMSDRGEVSRADFIAFQKVLFDRISNLEEELKEHKLLLRRILKHQTPLTDIGEKPDGMPHLPIKEVYDVPSVEEWAAVEENNQKLINYLAVIGGKDAEDKTRRVLSSIFTKKVASFYNWAGRKGKRPFSQSILKDILFRAVLKSSGKDEKITLDKVADAAKVWLKSSNYKGKNGTDGNDERTEVKDKNGTDDNDDRT